MNSDKKHSLNGSGTHISRILITTSHRPSDNARSLCKVLKHIIPSSILFPRGSNSEAIIHDVAINFNINYVLIIHSKGKQLIKLIVKKVNPNKLIQLPAYLEFNQFIDPKIFGWKRLPAHGPLSITRESRINNPELIDFLEKYFLIELKQKNPLWLMIDVNKRKTYIQFVDALTMKKIIFAEVKLRQKIRKKGE